MAQEVTALNEDPIGPLMLDIEGTELSPQDIDRLQYPCVGGVILFSRNYRDTRQLRELVGALRSTRPELLIAVDHEGGRVQRFKEGFTGIPPMAMLGRYFQQAGAPALALARDIGWLLAAELRAYDIDFSFTPVLDRDHGVSEVIGDRAFSSKPDIIVKLAEALMKGMEDAGMAATGKHFPGHGAVVADSHLALPVDERSYDEIAREDLCVFSTLISADIPALMPAHVVYSKVDDAPAGFSKVWMQDILRQKLGFKGVIFSDDLGMAGAKFAGGFADRAKAALLAGCDMVLVCNDPSGAQEVARFLEREGWQSSTRLQAMRGRSGPLSHEALEETPRWQNTVAHIKSLLT